MQADIFNKSNMRPSAAVRYAHSAYHFSPVRNTNLLVSHEEMNMSVNGSQTPRMLKNMA